MPFVLLYTHIDNDFKLAFFGNVIASNRKFKKFFCGIILRPATIIPQKNTIVNMV